MCHSSHYSRLQGCGAAGPLCFSASHIPLFSPTVPCSLPAAHRLLAALEEESDAARLWESFSQNPEAILFFTWLCSDTGAVRSLAGNFYRALSSRQRDRLASTLAAQLRFLPPVQRDLLRTPRLADAGYSAQMRLKLSAEVSTAPTSPFYALSEA